MQVIASHDISLYGDDGEHALVLIPLSDAHLTLFYRWSAISMASVRRKYGALSREALCFIVNVDGVPVGECRLWHESHAGARRIEIWIAEQAYQGRSTEAACIRMVTEYAFTGENANAVYGICADVRPPSTRMWTQNGFTLERREGEGVRYTLTRQDFTAQRRVIVPPERVFELPIAALQPSQLCVSAGKLRMCREWFEAGDGGMDAIPVKQFMGRTLMTDGHSRAVMAHLAGMTKVPCYWDTDALDMIAYAADIALCLDAGIRSPIDLVDRIVPVKEYERVWRKCCMELQDHMLYRNLKQDEMVIFWTQKQMPVSEHDIRWVDNLEMINHHLELSGQGLLAEPKWREMMISGIRYACLFESDQPVARACIEPLGGAFWELSDVRVAKAHRKKGYGRAISAHVLNLIIGAGKIATCRTLPENEGMNAIIRGLGFSPLFS